MLRTRAKIAGNLRADGHGKSQKGTELNRVTSQNVAKASGLIVALVVVIYGGIRVSHRYHAISSLAPATSRGRQAPDFALSTLDGKIVHLSDYRGKAVLLNFFGDTCVPCLEESPWLVDIQKRDGAKGLDIIGIEMYGASNDAIRSYARKFATNYTLVHGNDAVAGEYGIGSFPTSYFLNARGTIVAATVGLHSESETEAYVQAALLGK